MTHEVGKVRYLNKEKKTRKNLDRWAQNPKASTFSLIVTFSYEDSRFLLVTRADTGDFTVSSLHVKLHPVSFVVYLLLLGTYSLLVLVLARHQPIQLQGPEQNRAEQSRAEQTRHLETAFKNLKGRNFLAR